MADSSRRYSYLEHLSVDRLEELLDLAVNTDEEEKTEYRCGQGNSELDFLDLCLYAVGSGDRFLRRDENERDWSLYGAKPV